MSKFKACLLTFVLTSLGFTSLLYYLVDTDKAIEKTEKTRDSLVSTVKNLKKEDAVLIKRQITQIKNSDKKIKSINKAIAQARGNKEEFYKIKVNFLEEQNSQLKQQVVELRVRLVEHNKVHDATLRALNVSLRDLKLQKAKGKALEISLGVIVPTVIIGSAVAGFYISKGI